MFRSQENPIPEGAIPPYWNLPERNTPGLVVKALDVKRGFISLQIPPNPNIEDHQYRGEYAERYFDTNGNMTDYLWHTSWDTYIKVGKTFYTSHQWHRPLEDSSLDIRFEQDELPETASVANSLAGVSYEGGILKTIAFGYVFHHTDLQPTIPLTLVSQDIYDGGRYDYHDHPGLLRWAVDDVTIFDEKSLDLLTRSNFRVKNGVMIVEMENVATGVIKTISAPKKLDMRPVVKAMYGKQTAQKDLIRPDYVPAWRNLGKLTKTTLVYSETEIAA